MLIMFQCFVVKKVDGCSRKYQKTSTLIGLNNKGLHYLRNKKFIVRAIPRCSRSASLRHHCICLPLHVRSDLLLAPPFIVARRPH